VLLTEPVIPKNASFARILLYSNLWNLKFVSKKYKVTGYNSNR